MAEDQDLSEVLASGMCVACGACVAADPDLRLELSPERLLYQPTDKSNARAAAVCPAIHVDFAALQREIFGNAAITEHGVVDSVFLAQSANRERNLKASSGGLIRELLLHYLARKDVDGVIALANEGGLVFKPRLITELAQIDELPGSIYHNLALEEALRLLQVNEGRFVLVAIPCQLEGIYNYVTKLEPALAKRIHTTIGLICGWNYSHHALKAICDYKGLAYDEISAISYRGGGPVGKLRIETPERSTSISRRIDFSYQAAFDRSFNIPRCHVCINHCNFLADVVVGDAWLPSTIGTKTGIGIVICRKAETRDVLESMAARGCVEITRVTADEITESQGSDITFGGFAYSYAAFLRKSGEHCPEMTGPNRSRARVHSVKVVRKFHRELSTKLRLQVQGRYRRLRLRKATVELGALVGRYARWFLFRVLRVRSVLGSRRELPRARRAGFR